MKIKIIALLFVLIGLSSCSDFLNYDEVSQYTEEQVFTNFDRTKSFVTNIYSYLESDFCSIDGAMRAAGCDEAVHVWNSSNIHTFTNGTCSPLNTVDDVWAYNYKGIRAANFYLAKGTGRLFEEYKYADGYANNMLRYNNYEWEVRFLRAYFYFELVKRYGGVPLITKLLTPEEANNTARASFDECVQFIVEECDTVAKHLPISYGSDYNTETGRAPRAAAYALKSRLLLYAASKLHNPENDVEKWKAAAKAAKLVIDSAVVFKINNLQMYELITNNINCTEVIWDRREGMQGNFEKLNFPIGFEGGNTGTCPTQNLVDAYGMKTGTYSLTAPYTNRDPRLDKTVVLNNTKWAYNETVEAWEGGNSGLPKTGASPTGYYLKKYLVKDVSFKPSGNTSFLHTWVMFRYGEILLNYAEAVNEVFKNPNLKDTELNKTAIEVLNLVRRRTLVLMPNIATTTTYDNFVEIVRRERFVELAFEDHRFWDIRRWMIGDKTTEIYGMKIVKDGTKFIYTPQKIVDRVWDDKYYFYPISQAELNKNKMLKQNTGW